MTSTSKTPQNTSLRLAILLLAAGEGSRAGSIPKALLKKEGQSLLRRFCQVARGFAPTELLVVTGFHAHVMNAELALIGQDMDLPITTALNPHPELGQPSSVRLGLESLKTQYDILLVALSDQPMVGAQEIADLIALFEKRDLHCEMILPMVGQKRGNPVLFSKKAIHEILATPGMVCREYMDQNPELVQIFATENMAYVVDVDTKADIQKLGLDPI